MFISNFAFKTRLQKLLIRFQDLRDFSEFHPAREMRRLAARDSVRYARKHMRTAVGMESAREVLSTALQAVTVDGYYMEFGVYKGGTIRFIAKQTGAGKTIHGFDSFRGLEQAWSGNNWSFDAGGRLPKVPRNVTLHQGRFSETLPGWVEKNAGPAAFLHIDCDLYESTRSVFENLEDRIVPGTILVFDEYFNYPNWQEHEYKAFQELAGRCRIQYEYLAYAQCQVAVRITSVGRQDSPVRALQGSLAADLERQPV
ncbi:MAG TPA: class I SAM-dependent methyltransferase [Bryobacteraceae bacterium]|nr:class I SAM-dependent methyltransferase [Bryobacteraceae bacterium]